MDMAMKFFPDWSNGIFLLSSFFRASEDFSSTFNLWWPIKICKKLPEGVLSNVVVSRKNGSNEVGSVAAGSFKLVLSKKFIRAA